MSGAPHPVLDLHPQWRAYADLHGLTCLDDSWRGWRHRYTISCAKGHTSRKHLNQWTRADQPCSQCAAADRMARLQAAAAGIGARCLDERWLGAQARYRFVCQHGHEWSRPWAKCFVAMRCATCQHEAGRQAKMRHDGLAALQQAAGSRGGSCEADTYLGVAARYGFRCGQGHRWDAAGGEVLRGRWCLDCAHEAKQTTYRLPDGLERLRAAAASKGGSCLASSYVGAKARYLFRCQKNHEWHGQGAAVLRGAWCLKCAQDARRLTLTDAQHAAADRGGQCLSEAYINNATKMQWVCSRGHAWHAALATIRAGHWCKQCASMDMITRRNSKAARKYLPAAGWPLA